MPEPARGRGRPTNQTSPRPLGCSVRSPATSDPSRPYGRPSSGDGGAFSSSPRWGPSNNRCILDHISISFSLRDCSDICRTAISLPGKGVCFNGPGNSSACTMVQAWAGRRIRGTGGHRRYVVRIETQNNSDTHGAGVRSVFVCVLAISLRGSC